MWPFKEKQMFHKHDLNKWNYLGCTEIKFLTEGEVGSKTWVYFFIEKVDPSKRSYTLGSNLSESFKYHPFVDHYCKLWKIGTYTDWALCQTTPTKLAKRIAKDAGYAFDGKIWIKIVELPPEKKPTVVEDNVIKVDFGL